MSHSHNSQYIRRVVLPSGRAIEVVYFDQLPVDEAAGRAAAPVATPGEDLHVCPACEKSLVYPLEWEEASPTHWEVALRCPNCEWHTIGIFPQATVDRFDEELDFGTEALVGDLKRLTQANMEEEVERFSTALASNAIWPMDF